jgi:hypothetical protein
MEKAQRSSDPDAGTAADGRGAAGDPGKHTLTEAAQPGAGGSSGTAADGRPPNIAQLLRRVDNNPIGLHYALRAEPALRGEIEAYFATGRRCRAE